MIQVERHTIVQILGSLMKKPELLSDTDKYIFDVNEFNVPLDRFIFSAIYNLFINGAESIHAVDIDNYLQQNKYAKDLMENENGIAFLQDCETESEINNFDFYYKRFKKVNLVRDLQMSKNDIDEIYCEDILNENYQQINDRFEQMSIQDIINFVKGKGEALEKKYVINSYIEESTPAENIRERVMSWKDQPEIGCMLQGEAFNTITRGGRKGKLYLRSAGSGIGKSRSMVGDACNLAYPIRYDATVGKWIITGNSEKVLYIMTEQDTEEIDTMIMAYLTGYNEDVFVYGTFDPNDPRILGAIDIMERYKDNMHYARVPDPCSSVIKNLIRRRNLQDGIENFFYDYIFSSPAMLNEYRDLKIREDVALRLFTTTLKNLAVELNVFIMTATQISNDDENKDGGFRDFRNIRGSSALVDLVDFACIMSRPSVEELNSVSGFNHCFGYSPNLVIDIFKNRRGRWNMVRIWSYFDAGTCRRQDLFVTTNNIKPLPEFSVIDFNIDKTIYIDLQNLYNTGYVSETTESYYEEKQENILSDFERGFADEADKKLRVKDKDFSDYL